MPPNWTRESEAVGPQSAVAAKIADGVDMWVPGCHPLETLMKQGLLAERAGFEPAVGYEPTHAFQACDLNRSSISPEPRILAWRRSVARCQLLPAPVACTIFIAEAIKVDTSLMLLGTTRVVLASAARRP